jgi:isopenicillin-N epimerase
MEMSDFFLDPAVVFLNHGSFGATPRRVLEEQRKWQEKMERQPVDFMVRQLEPALWRALDTSADFVGTSTENLVFVPNATTGVNAVLQQMPLKPGDQILTTSHRYEAVGNALKYTASKYGAAVQEAELPFPADAETILERVESRMGTRTRLLVIDQITSATATYFPVEELLALARGRGIRTLVDGAHAPGQLTLDLDAMAPDYWTGNLHKWTCAPKGAALLYVAPRHQNDFHANVISHGYQTGWQREFGWVGTQDFSAYLASAEAITLHEEWGGEAYREANHRLMKQASSVILGRFPRLPAPEAQPTLAMRSFLLNGVQAQPLYDALQAVGIEVVVHPWGEDCILRISCFSRYNHIGQYQTLVDALSETGLMPKQSNVGPR